jgi:hypothetical protein
MNREAPNTLYFAIGFFTGDQLEEKHRAMLARAASNPAVPVPVLKSSMLAVHVTIFMVKSGTGTVEVDVKNVAMRTPGQPVGGDAGSRFVLEKFNPRMFPNGLTPEEAFIRYLNTEDGINVFGKAAAVQLISMDMNTVDDGANLVVDTDERRSLALETES